MATKGKAQYAKPASQVDLEERLANGNESSRVLSTSDSYKGAGDEGDGRDFRVEDNDVTEYVGTSPEYATYANETEAPLKSEKGAEAEIFESFAASPVPATLRVEGNVEYEGEKESQEAAASSDEDSSSSTTPEATPSASSGS